MIVSDQLSTSPLPIYIDNTGVGFTQGDHHKLTIENDVETQFIELGDGSDSVEIGSTQTGMHVDTGGGDDIVDFGGGDQMIPTNLDPATFVGGDGNDRVVFDDSATVLPGTNPGMSIPSPQPVLDQTLSGFEQLDLDAARRTGLTGTSNQIVITGNPGLATLNLFGLLNDGIQNIRSVNDVIIVQGSPVDFDSLHLAINFNLFLHSVQINDQDVDHSDNPWVLNTTTAADGTQFVSKGSMTIAAHANPKR